MNTKRRHFLSLTTGTFINFFYNNFSFAKKNCFSPIFLSSAVDKDGHFYICCLNHLGIEIFRKKIPERGHGIAYKTQSKEAAIFSRRPGKHITIIDTLNGEIIEQFKSKIGRHFYGHGTYSENGLWLYASENEYDSGRGVIGVYDVKDNYRLVENLYTYGIGPHEIKLLSGENILVVANGGILTHPDYGRKKMNLDIMESSLTYIEVESGKKIVNLKLSPKLQLMSIRHIELGPDNEIALAMQYQGPKKHLHPLVGFQKGSEDIIFGSATNNILYKMKNYCGSVDFDSTGKLLAVSSPRGGIITFWSVPEKRFLSLLKIQDGCGISPGKNPESFLITNGLGCILEHSPLTQTTEFFSIVNLHWDNHLIKA